MKRLETKKMRKDIHIKESTTCAIISRKPHEKDDEFKTAVVALYTTNNPHKINGFPTKIYEFPDIEKVRIKSIHLSYYLEGNDLIINDLEEIYMIREGNILVVKGYQFEVERRVKN